MRSRFPFTPNAVFLVCVATHGIVDPAFTQEDLYISGYGNVHYMNHDGMPATVGSPPLDNGFFQLREFSLFFDFLITDSIIASTEIEAGDNGNTYTSNYAYVDIQASENLPSGRGSFWCRSSRTTRTNPTINST